MSKKLKSLSKNQIVVLTVLIVFVILEVALFMTGIIEFNSDAMKGNQDENENQQVSTTTDGEIPEMTTEVDEDATTTQAQEIVDVTSDPESNEQLGMYTVTVSSDGYLPNNLVIEEGTIVSITLRSEGGDYDFYIPATGNYIQADEGEEDESSFRINQTGTYRFECRDLCPSGEKIQGTLQVKPKQ